jgi:hypothetical protein
MKKKNIVFVCSPYSGRDIQNNIVIAKDICKKISQNGDIPIAPHLYFPQFLNDNLDEERKLGIESGKQLLEKCDLMYIYTSNGNMTKGMKIEYKHALKLQKTIYIYDISQFCDIKHTVIPKLMDYYTYKNISFKINVLEKSTIKCITKTDLPYRSGLDGYYIIVIQDCRYNELWQSPAFELDPYIFKYNINDKLLIEIFDYPSSFKKRYNLKFTIYKIDPDKKQRNCTYFREKYSLKIKKIKDKFIDLQPIISDLI